MGISKLLSAILVLGLLFLAACSPQAKQGSPTPVTGEPVLSISGDDDIVDPGDFEDVETTDSDLMDTDDAMMDVDTSTDSTTEPATPVKNVKEGDLVKFENLKATDADGDKLSFTFTKPLNSKGEWQTQRGDAGEYETTISVSDGKTSVSQEVKIVVESINKEPVLTLEKEINVKEGEEVNLNVEATDGNDDDVILSFSGWMNSPTKKTSSADVGTHTVTVTANDGFSKVTKEVTITVEDVNYAPKLDALQDVQVTEGEKVVIVPTATDRDGDKLTYMFSEPLDKNGVWETKDGDRGQYSVTVTVTDGKLNDSTTLDVEVKRSNKIPEISLTKTSITVDEGETVKIKYSVSDLDGDDVDVTFSGWMTSDTYTTDFDDAGTHTVTLTADDGFSTTSEQVTVTVKDVNQPPVFDKGAFT